MQQGDIQSHFHLRKRARRPHAVHYAYPSSDRFIHFFDKVIYVASVVGPLVMTPQLIKIYAERSAQGFSLVAWVGNLILTSIWLLYGILHRERAIIIAQILWLLINLFVVIGILIYK